MGQQALWLDRTKRVRIKPDLLFGTPPATWAYVADAKYKLTDDGLGRHPDYYQLLAYCTSLGLDEGMLIYAATEAEEPAREVVVRGSGVRLVSYRLPLGGSQSEIGRAVDGLASTIRRRLADANEERG